MWINKEDEWTPPDEYWVVNFGGSSYAIDQPTKDWIEKQITDGNNEYFMLSFTSIEGWRVTNIIKNFDGFWYSSPEARKRERQIVKMLDDEKGYEE